MKLDDQITLELRVELEEMITEREGMIAENSIIPKYIKYGEDAFDALRERMKNLRDRLIKYKVMGGDNSC